MVNYLKKIQNIVYVFKVLLLIVSVILFFYIRLSHNFFKNIFSALLVLCILIPLLVRREKSFGKTLFSFLCLLLITIFQFFVIFKQQNISEYQVTNTISNEERQIKDILESSYTSYFNSCITDTGNKIYCEEKAKGTQEKLQLCFSKYSVNKLSIEEILKKCSLDYLKERALTKCISSNIFNEPNKKELEYMCETYGECLVDHYEKSNQLNVANEVCIEKLRLKNSMKK